MRIGSPLPHKKARIEIIPLIHLMFFLLASFLMASLSMIRLQQSAKMDLPAAKTAQRDFKPDIVNISVGKAGEIFLEKTQINLGELHAYLANRYRVNTNFPVFISGDKDARHGAITRVLAVVHNEGIQKVSFAISPAPAAPK